MKIVIDNYLKKISDFNFWDEVRYQTYRYVEDIGSPIGYHQYTSEFLPIDIIVSYYDEDTIFIETYPTDTEHPKTNGGRYL